MLEEKLKKVTTEKAPVAGAPVSSSAGGRGGLSYREQQQNLRDQQQLLAQALRGSSADVRSINNLFRQAQAGGIPGFGNLPGGRAADALARGQGEGGSGAAAAAGVLTAIDEDNEGDEEAPVPTDFEYFTDGEDEGL